MTSILTGPALVNLPVNVQNTVVVNFCTYLMEQMKDWRIRGRRSELGKPILGSKDDGTKDEMALFGVIYDFLAAYLSWEDALCRSGGLSEHRELLRKELSKNCLL